MMKKWNMRSPLIKRRRFFYFLVTFLLTSSMSYAICNPQEAYTIDNSQEEQLPSGKIYISEGATLFIAEDTIISDAEIIHFVTDAKKTEAKPYKKDAEQKVVKQTVIPAKPIVSAPPVEFISSKEPGQIWSTNGSSSKQVSTAPNSGIKYLAVVIDSKYFTAILLFIALLIAVYQRHIINRLLFGHNFQRPPPIFFKISRITLRYRESVIL